MGLVYNIYIVKNKKRVILMTEILWHGRGGQGAFTAAKL